MMIDITLPHIGGFSWWDDPLPSITFVDSGAYKVGYISMSLHSGTHIDLPLHVGLDVAVKLKDAYIVEVINIMDIDMLASKCSNNVDGWLIKTGQGKPLKDGSIDKNYVALNYSQAQHIVSCNPELIGIEAPSIEEYEGSGTVHKIFLKRGIPILENIDLTDVDMALYMLYLYTLHVRQPVDALPAIALLQRWEGE